MRRRLYWRHLVAVLLLALVAFVVAADYDALLKHADAMIEVPCQMTPLPEAAVGASCYRLNWSSNPLDYISSFTEIEFDRTWSMNAQGEYSRPFTLGGVRYEALLATAGDREHYVRIQPLGVAMADVGRDSQVGPLSSPQTIDAEFIASRLGSVTGGATASCEGYSRRTLNETRRSGGFSAFPSLEPTCLDLNLPGSDVRDAVELLAATYVDWDLSWPSWEFSEVVELYSRELWIMLRDPDQGQVFTVVVDELPDGTSFLVVQEIQLRR